MNAVRRSLVVLVVAALALVGLAVTGPSAGAATNTVLVIAAADQGYVDDVVAGLATTGGYATVDSINLEGGGTVSPEDLVGFDAVVVMADGSWPDPTALGTLLADFVDGGGRVVETVFTLYCAESGSGLSGRWVTGGYGALVGDAECDQIDGDGPLGISAVLADSPFLTGGLGFSGGDSSYRNTVVVGSGATLVANWADPDSTPFLAYKAVGTGFVVGVNFFPPSSDARSDFWTAGTGGFQLLVNALGVGGVAPTTTTTTTAVPATPTTTVAAAGALVTPAFTG